MLRSDYKYLPARLNATEFAVCLGCCEEVVRRKLRANIHGVRRFTDGPPWRVSPEALALFKVTPQAALLALQQAAASRSAAAALDVGRLVSIKEAGPAAIEAFAERLAELVAAKLAERRVVKV